MKTIKLFCILFIAVFLFGGCSTPNNDESVPTDENVFNSQNRETESISNNIGMNRPSEKVTKKSVTGDKELSVDDAIKAMEGQKFLASAMFLSPTDPECFSPLVYNGGDFVFYYQIGSTTDKEYNIGFTLNGVYQDIKIEHNGQSTDYAVMHRVGLKAGENKILKIMLRPNIGKKGDVLQFCNATISSIESKITQDNLTYDDHVLSNTLPSDFVMNSDSTSSVSVNSSYKNVTIGNYSTNLRKYFTQINDTEELCQMIIYNELGKVVYRDTDAYKTLMSFPVIEAQASAAFPLTIAMSGKSGTTQRISLYINDEIVPAFDGQYYADVKMERGKQTTVNLTIDTLKLDTWNNIYCVTYTHNADAMDPYVLSQSNVYVLKVVK